MIVTVAGELLEKIVLRIQCVGVDVVQCVLLGANAVLLQKLSNLQRVHTLCECDLDDVHTVGIGLQIVDNRLIIHAGVQLISTVVVVAVGLRHR